MDLHALPLSVWFIAGILIVGVGFRKLGPRSLSATPEYVILAGICFPRSEACATFGLLERVEPPSRAWCVRTVFGLEAL